MTRESKETRVFEISGSEERGGSKNVVEPSSKADLVTEFNLISHWETGGDVVDNAIQGSHVGAEIILGARFPARVSGGTIEITELSKVFDPDGRRVAAFELCGEYSANLGGKVFHYESTHRFNTSGWQPGWYSAELVVRDLHRDVISEPAAVEFELRRGRSTGGDYRIGGRPG